MEIGSKLKLARQNAEYTQEQAASRLNVSRQTISNWENNRTYPELSLVIKMSDMYGLSLDELLKENSGYINYISSGTKKHSPSYYISVIVESVIFLLIWGTILFLFYSNPPADNAGYVILIYGAVFPPLIFIFSAIIGADRHWGRFKWVLIPILAYSVCFMDFCTFNTNSLFTGGDVFLGIAFEFLPFFVISFIGMLAGYIIYGAYKKIKAKRKKNGTGNKA